MEVKVTSNIFGKTDLSGNYQTAAKTLEQFLQEINVKWNHEALIAVNEEIVDANYSLLDGDHILLLTPIYGG